MSFSHGQRGQEVRKLRFLFEKLWFLGPRTSGLRGQEVGQLWFCLVLITILIASMKSYDFGPELLTAGGASRSESHCFR